MRVQQLPCDLQEKIYRIYYNDYVLPCIMKARESEHPSISYTAVQTAMSRAYMYTKGTMDITDVPYVDRMRIYSELLKNKVFNMQVHMKASRILVTTHVYNTPNVHMRYDTYDDIMKNAVSRMFTCRSGYYVVRYRNIRQDVGNHNVYNVEEEEHDEIVGTCWHIYPDSHIDMSRVGKTGITTALRNGVCPMHRYL